MEEPLSEAFESVLAVLELVDATLPDDEEVVSWRRSDEYDGVHYVARPLISDTSFVSVDT